MADSAHPFGNKSRYVALINSDWCTGCGYCAMFCIMECIPQQPDGIYRVDAERCIGCRSCKVNCPYEAVSIVPVNQED